MREAEAQIELMSDSLSVQTDSLLLTNKNEAQTHAEELLRLMDDLKNSAIRNTESFELAFRRLIELATSDSGVFQSADNFRSDTEKKSLLWINCSQNYAAVCRRLIRTQHIWLRLRKNCRNYLTV